MTDRFEPAHRAAPATVTRLRRAVRTARTVISDHPRDLAALATVSPLTGLAVGHVLTATTSTGAVAAASALVFGVAAHAAWFARFPL